MEREAGGKQWHSGWARNEFGFFYVKKKKRTIDRSDNITIEICTRLKCFYRDSEILGYIFEALFQLL